MWNRTRSTLVAVSETNTVTALLSDTDPADLRPLVTGRRTPRLTSTQADLDKAAALIAARKAGA